MYDNKLAFRIKNFLQHKNRAYRIKELEKVLHVGKHKRKDLVHTLQKLAQKNEISYKNRKYSDADIPAEKIVVGKFDATAISKNKSYAFVNSDKFDIFISSENILNAYHGDTVKVQIKYNRKGKRYGQIVNILERNTEIFVGNIEKYHGKYYLLPDNPRIHTDIVIGDLKGADPKQKVMVKIKYWGDPERYKLPIGDVVEILGPAGDPQIEILSVIKQYDLPLEFPEKVISETMLLKNNINAEISHRKDKRNLLTITIDPASAKDYDDAISLQEKDRKFILYIHIADVAHYVKQNSAIFQEAVKRGNSYYFPKKVLPMLPEKLSNKICSLRPFEDKLTITQETVFDKNFQILSQNSYESVIRSSARFNYEEIDELFAGNKTEIDEKIKKMLFQMKEISEALSQKRQKEGYIYFELPETEFLFDDEGRISDLKRSEGTASHKLIENFMLLANEFVAKKLSSQPTIYRIHEDPEEDRLLALKEKLKFYQLDLDLNLNINSAVQKLLDSLPDAAYHRVFDRMVLRSLMKAKYSIENVGHFGLGLEYYTHFTSPIRRLSDLIIHHQLKRKLRKQPDKFSKSQLFDLAKRATICENTADNSEKDVEIKNKILFMKDKLGEEFSGIITSIRPSSLIIELDRYPVTGIVSLSELKDDHYSLVNGRLIGKRKGKIYSLMDKVKVLISKVSDDIYFQILKGKAK